MKTTSVETTSTGIRARRVGWILAAAAILVETSPVAGAQETATTPATTEAVAAAADDDLILRVLQDELNRSMERLRLEGKGGPYYLEYVVDETEGWRVAASFGALAGEGRDRRRSLEVDLRVGDYDLDNTNFAEGGYGRGFGGGRWRRTGLTVDDDYDALRHEVWLATDGEYKGAVEALEKKKAFLQTNLVKDRPADLSREEPVVEIDETKSLRVDPDHWTDVARRLSGIFRDYPAVQASMVTFESAVQNRWFVNSEGFVHRKGTGTCGLFVLAVAQAEDGMSLGDQEMFVARTTDAMPSYEEMEAAVRSLGDRLTALVAAPLLEDEYVGPVLFEGRAAAGFLGSVLVPHLAAPVEPLGAGGRRGGGGNPLRDKIGQRILPRSVTVVDDPLAKEWEGTPLLGGYTIDDDGVRARRITLVDGGKLQTFCMSRVPTRPVQGSNGHSRGGRGAPSNLFVESEETLPPDELREELRQLGLDEGLDHVYVARRLAGPAAMMVGSGGFFFGGGPGSILVPAPLYLYRVSLDDGSERLVRGGRFGDVTIRILRDVVAMGDDARPYLAGGGPFGADEIGGHMVTPSLLVEEMEIRKPSEEQEKPPVLPHPFFAK